MAMASMILSWELIELDSNGYDSGASYIVFGKASGFAAELDVSSLDGSNGFRLAGENEHETLGFSSVVRVILTAMASMM